MVVISSKKKCGFELCKEIVKIFALIIILSTNSYSGFVLAGISNSLSAVLVHYRTPTKDPTQNMKFN